MTTTKSIPFTFRWPIKQTSETTIQVEVPLGNRPAIITPEFASTHNLSDKEIDNAESAVLQEIALVK